MAKQTTHLDMLSGSIAKKLLLFALPLAVSSALQQLFNAADIAVVGRFSGTEALAAVGANSSLITMFVNLFTGLSLGTNVAIAQDLGSGDTDRVQDFIHTSVLFSLYLGAGVCILMYCIARPVLQAMNTPPEVLDLAVKYLRIYVLGMPFISLYNFASAILRTVGDTKRPMVALAFGGIINVLLNLLLVIVFKLGVAGVAIATAVSNVVSSVWVLRLLMHEEPVIRVALGKLHVRWTSLSRILRIGLPSAVQGMAFSFSNVCLQSGINSFGANATGAASAVGTFNSINYLSLSAYNSAVTTFVGQNYGAGKFDRCRKTIRIGIVEGILTMVIVGGTMLLFRHKLILIFTTDPDVISYAMVHMCMILGFHWMMVPYEIPGSGLRGMGDSVTPAVCIISGTVVFRIVWLFTVFKVWSSYVGLMAVYPASWLVTTVVLIPAYLVISKKRIAKAALESEKKGSSL